VRQVPPEFLSSLQTGPIGRWQVRHRGYRSASSARDRKVRPRKWATLFCRLKCAEAKQQAQQERWREGRARYERLAVLVVCLAASREGLCSVRGPPFSMGGRPVASRPTNLRNGPRRLLAEARRSVDAAGHAPCRRGLTVGARRTHGQRLPRTGKPTFGQCRPFEASAVTSPMRWREEGPQSWRETLPETDRRPCGRSPHHNPNNPIRFADGA
jgi:hypothetical protein